VSRPDNKTARPIIRTFCAVAQHSMSSNDSQRRLMAKTAEPHGPTTHSMVKKLCRSSKLQHATAVMLGPVGGQMDPHLDLLEANKLTPEI
jgi:hypothetical protein